MRRPKKHRPRIVNENAEKAADPKEAYRLARQLILKAVKTKKFDLRLDRLGLKSLPPEIGRCTSLAFLHLQGNQLTTLPAELSKCSELEWLDLDENEFRTIPDVLTACPNLKVLWLMGNHIRTFPSKLLKCQGLISLSLANNGLTNLPSAIGRLRGLEELHLQENKIAKLPLSLRRLDRLIELFLHDNDGLHLPPEVLGPRWPITKRDLTPPAIPKSILDYYFSRLGGSKPLSEVKMIFVGRGGAGKTSLVNRLVNDSFRHNERETPGVAITDWVIETARGGRVTAHVWDFAGQVITHAMHQFFFSTRTVYVLVLTGRENAERDDAEYWLRLIAAFGSEQQDVLRTTVSAELGTTSDTPTGPPVIVVLNKWDDPGSARARLDRAALRERYPFIVTFLETDCATRLGVDQLEETISETIGTLEWVSEGFPSKWARVSHRLRANPQPHLSYESYRRICREEGVTVESEQDSLSENLHRLGVALNYRDDKRLKFASVLKPHWLTENVYALVRHAEKNAGVLARSALPEVLLKEKDPTMRQFLVDMMVRFELAYPLAEEGEEPTRWLVPQALPDDQPPGAEAFRSVKEATRLRFVYRALPANIVPQFIVRTHSFLEIDDNHKRVQWASGAVLSRSGARALVRADAYDRVVEVIATGPGEARQQLAGLCQAELRAINDIIQGLNPDEETEVVISNASGQIVRGWVAISSLEKSEASNVQGALSVENAATVMFDPTAELNEFTKAEARDDSWKPRVFICYSQKDDRSRKTLEMHLKILRTQGLLEASWTDQSLDPGDDWDSRIKIELERADVIVMLASPEALATDYIRKVEMPRALARHAVGQARAIAIILKDCSYQQTPLGKWQVILPNRRPVLDNSPQRKGWAAVEKKLSDMFQQLRKKHR
jgi:internalin A